MPKRRTRGPRPSPEVAAVFRTRETSAWTEGGRFRDLTLDLSGFTDVVIDATFERTTFVGIGEHLGAGGTPRARLVDCRFVGSHFRRVALSTVDLERCEFVDCTIDDLVTDAADLVGCRFTGRIRSAIIRRDLPGECPGCPQPTVPPRFVDNDFSGCQLDDVEFRGGIDLRRQVFSSAQQARIVRDVRARLDAVLLAHPEDILSRSQRIRVEMLRDVVRYRQRDCYLGRWTDRDDSSTRQLMQWLDDVCVPPDPPGYVWTPDDPVFPPAPGPATALSQRDTMLQGMAMGLINACKLLGDATLDDYLEDWDRQAAVGLQLAIAAAELGDLQASDAGCCDGLPGVAELAKLEDYIGAGASAAKHRRAYRFMRELAPALIEALRAIE